MVTVFVGLNFGDWRAQPVFCSRNYTRFAPRAVTSECWWAL